MSGETILIVEDSPESLKFTAGVLRREGYRVTIASTAEQALSTLRFLQPDLILVDFMLPGMNGLELTSRIKQEPRLQQSVVVALTAMSSRESELGAREAGCDGYLTKPIDASTLLARLRHFLDHRKGPIEAVPSAVQPEPAAEQGMTAMPDEQLAELRESFLKAGRGVSRQLVNSLEALFDADKSRRTVHQWIGSAGLLGFPAITGRAQAVETVLLTPPVDADLVRGPLTSLARTFQSPAGLSESALQAAVRVLRGKNVALIGLSSEAADLMCASLQQVGARARLFEPDQSPYGDAVGLCHLIVVHVRPENMSCRWLVKEAPGLPALPTLFLGGAQHLLALTPQAQARADGLLVDGCLPEEVLMRLRLGATRPHSSTGRNGSPRTDECVIAYADTASHPLIEARMKDCGLRCHLASNGPETILLLRHVRPPVAVVDVNLDGFEALAAIRAEAMPVRTVFIASQTHEDDVLRGFSLGAEDYLVQPFSPLELVARLKRLLA